MLLEIAWRHLLGGRFAIFFRYRWRRWLSALLACALTIGVAVQLALSNYPVWGVVSLFGMGILMVVVHRLVHGPLPEQARGAYASAVTFVAVLGIAIAVMTLIVVVSVMDGFTLDIQQALLKTTAEVMVTTFEERIDPTVVDQIRKVEGVRFADPYIENDMLMKIDGYDRPAAIKLRGQTVASFLRPGGADLKAGDWGDLDKPGHVMIGAEMARIFGLKPGDRIWLVTSGGTVTSMGVVPVMEEVTVAGIFRTGFYEVDQSLVFAGMQTAREIVGTGDLVTGIDVTGNDPYEAPRLAMKLRREIPMPLVILSWAETRRNLYEAMQTERIAMFVIESLLILIASFNISSTLFMAVGKKTREIGLLLSLGMERARILALFALEGFLIGASGTTVGTIVGLAFCLYLERFKIQMPGGGEVYYIDSIPVAISPGLIVSTVVCSLLISLVASVYPALRAARMSPAKALKYE
ncbi:MAG: ABC transporter permease [Candidatus Hydrogenedentota bacterium]